MPASVSSTHYLNLLDKLGQSWILALCPLDRV